MEIRILEYVNEQNKSPFADWLDSLDLKIRARVRTRIDRIRRGNFGDSKHLGAGVHELRLDFGPGYRVYYAKDGTEIVLLLAGGDKSSQQGDIKKAKEFWSDYRDGLGRLKEAR